MCVLNLHVKALLKALVYVILWFNHNVMDVVNIIVLFLTPHTNFSLEISKIY